MKRVPICRAEAKGLISKFMADCESSFRGEMRHCGDFVFAYDDCRETLETWSLYLTDAELQKCFLRAISKI